MNKPHSVMLADRAQEAEAMTQRAAQWFDTGIPVNGRAAVGDVIGYHHAAYGYRPCEVVRPRLLRDLATDMPMHDVSEFGFTFARRIDR